MTVLLTADRYIAVCKPLKIRTCCGTARTWTIITLMIATSVLFSLPRCFEFRLVNDEAHTHLFSPTPLTHDPVYVMFYRTSLFRVRGSSSPHRQPGRVSASLLMTNLLGVLRQGLRFSCSSTAPVCSLSVLGTSLPCQKGRLDCGWLAPVCSLSSCTWLRCH